MSQNQLPNGWDETRVRKLLAHYDEQSQDEAMAEDEEGVASSANCISMQTMRREGLTEVLTNDRISSRKVSASPSHTSIGLRWSRPKTGPRG